MAGKRVCFVLMVVLAVVSAGNAMTRRRVRHSRRHAAPASQRHSSPRRRRSLRRVAWNPLFAGSHEMLVRQNVQLDQLELPRIADEDELVTREDAGELVPVQDSDSLVVAANLAENHRYCKPWTRDFLEDLGTAYYEEFHQPIIATSLVRTAEQQKKLRRRNRNAAPEEGETASTHLTGVTVDILKRGMTRKQHQWLEQYFLPLAQAGMIEPIEELHQPVFHVVVYNSYPSQIRQPEEPSEAPAPAPQPDMPETGGEN
jgi:hypothetical protein